MKNATSQSCIPGSVFLDQLGSSKQVEIEEPAATSYPSRAFRGTSFHVSAW